MITTRQTQRGSFAKELIIVVLFIGALVAMAGQRLVDIITPTAVESVTTSPQTPNTQSHTERVAEPVSFVGLWIKVIVGTFLVGGGSLVQLLAAIFKKPTPVWAAPIMLVGTALLFWLASNVETQLGMSEAMPFLKAATVMLVLSVASLLVYLFRNRS